MLTEYSEKQRQAARMLARPDDHRTLREMSELLEVPVSTLCRWRNDPKFQSYLQQLTERYTTPQGERQRIGGSGGPVRGRQCFRHQAVF